jgi:cupin fold WbuC family metalloprotein
MKLAFDNIKESVFTLDINIIKKGIEASRKSERKRIILPIHRQQDARVQRMLNFLQPGTYIRPHKHPLKDASESIIVLQGALRFFIFDNNGKVNNDYYVTTALTESVLDIEPGVWHSFVVLEKDTVIFESKKGPYNALEDKQFARWSPEEYTPEAKHFINELYNLD